MNLSKPRVSTVEFEGEQLSVKHLSTREYIKFTEIEDKNQALKYMVQTSLGISNEQYDDMPMSVLAQLPALILKANGLDAKTEEDQGN